MAQAHAKPQHDYHLLNPSPWPLVGAVGAITLALGTLMYFMSKKAGDPQLWYVLPGLAIVLITMYGWWRDVIKEADEGYQSPVVQLHLRYGMILFIASEVMFFVAWFWAYFDVALFPDDAVTYARTQVTGGVWLFRTHLRSLGPALDQYADPFDVGHDGNLGASRHVAQSAQRTDLGARHHGRPGADVHGLAGV